MPDQDAVALERGFALLLEEVASPHGSPAGGTTIAWSLALAASLAELCVGVTVRRGEAAGAAGGAGVGGDAAAGAGGDAPAGGASGGGGAAAAGAGGDAAAGGASGGAGGGAAAAGDPAALDAIRARGVQARALRVRALELGDRDRDAYAAVLEAERAGDEPARVAALAAAADVLVELVQTATEVSELSARLTVESVPIVAGDATAATLLAEAVARASAHLVEIDLAAHPDDPRADHATALADRATAARADALGGF